MRESGESVMGRWWKRGDCWVWEMNDDFGIQPIKSTHSIHKSLKCSEVISYS